MLEGDVHEVGFGPHLEAVALAVAVASVGCEAQGHFIFIEVVFHIGTKADKHGEFATLEVGRVVDQRFGVNPHLETLVVAQVLHGVAVDATRIAGIKTGDFERQRLLVELHNL